MPEYDYDEFRPISPSAAFFILIGLVGAGLVIGSLVAFGVWYGNYIFNTKNDKFGSVY